MASLSLIVQNNLIEMAARNMIGDTPNSAPWEYDAIRYPLQDSYGYQNWQTDGTVPPESGGINSINGINCNWPNGCYRYRVSTFSDATIEWVEIDAIPINSDFGFKLFQYQFRDYYDTVSLNKSTSDSIIFSGVLRSINKVQYQSAADFFPNLSYPTAPAQITNFGQVDNSHFFQLDLNNTGLTRILLPNGSSSFVGRNTDQNSTNHNEENIILNLSLSSILSTYKYRLNIFDSDDPEYGDYSVFAKEMVVRMLEYFHAREYFAGMSDQSSNYQSAFVGNIIPDVNTHFSGNINSGIQGIFSGWNGFAFDEYDGIGFYDSIDGETGDLPDISPKSFSGSFNGPIYVCYPKLDDRNPSTLIIGGAQVEYSPSDIRYQSYAFWSEGVDFAESSSSNAYGTYPDIFKVGDSPADGDFIHNMDGYVSDSTKTIISTNLSKYCSLSTI